MGAIIGSAIPPALGLGEVWQFLVLGAGAVGMFALRLSVVWTLLAGAIGAILAVAGVAVPV